MSAGPISVLDVKNALKDEKFRNTLPDSLKEPVQKFLSNPNCSCNLKIYQQILAEAKDQITAYYPDKSYVNPDEQVKEQTRRLAQNSFKVINCSIGELEETMKKLPAGRKQVTLARWEDQVTVLINELEIVY
jgi:cell fate (sporulation/competence/biofilm development) regulator YlbF (YheA/YmcA/DUF963 family)